MAILFDWYENPQSSEQQGEENALHPRLRQRTTFLNTGTELGRAHLPIQPETRMQHILFPLLLRGFGILVPIK